MSEDRKPIGLSLVAELGSLGAGAIVTETALAAMCGKCVRSIRRAVERGELPAPTRLMAARVWTVGALVKHIESRLDDAAVEARALQRRITRAALG